MVEGLDVLWKINTAYLDEEHRPYQNIRIKHTLIIDDPWNDDFEFPSRSPSPIWEMNDWIEDDVDLKQLYAERYGEDKEEVEKKIMAKARAEALVALGDIPDSELAPPENVLFVCKLNKVTSG